MTKKIQWLQTGWSGWLCPIVAYPRDVKEVGRLIPGVRLCPCVSAMPSSVRVWWILKSVDFYVYQCNSEALMMTYLRNVSSLSLFFFFVFFSFCHFFVLFVCFSLCIYMHTSEIAVWNSGVRCSFQKTYLVPGGSWIIKMRCIVVVKVLMIAWRRISLIFFFTYGI